MKIIVIVYYSDHLWSARYTFNLNLELFFGRCYIFQPQLASTKNYPEIQNSSLHGGVVNLNYKTISSSNPSNFFLNMYSEQKDLKC